MTPRDDMSELQDLLLPDDEEPRRGSRVIPGLVMMTAFAGFIALSWYAYTAGTRSVQDDEILLVEADKTPMKEKPADPGGMQFPNQDKTIFEAISGAPKPQVVERVLPTPEEPINREQADASAQTTKTWVNEKLQQADAQANNAAKEVLMEKPKVVAAAPVQPVPAPQQMAQPIPAPTPQEAQAMAKVQPAAGTPSPAPAAPVPTQNAMIAQAGSATVTSGAVTYEPPTADAPAQTAIEVSPQPVAGINDKPKEVAKAEKPKKKVAKASGGATVQLGAYRSEEEAKKAWGALSKKYSSELGGRDPSIVQADLGEKGVFYRVRVNVADAKGTCSTLTAKGQACIVVK